MSDRWNGEVEIVSGIAAENEIPQERPNGRNQLLGRFSATPTRAIQQKCTYHLGIPLAHIFTKCIEQFRCATGVQPKSRLGSATMHMKPVAEGNDQCRQVVGNAIGRTALTDALLYQLPVEKFYSKASVIAGLPSVVPRATTARKVSAKSLQQALIHIFQRATFALQKTTEMGCGA